MEWKKPKAQNNDEKDWPETKKWNPEGPAELVGVLKEKKSVKDQFNGGLITLLEIEDATGDLWTVWCNRTALRNLAAENDAELIVGRVVGIKTEGKTTLESGKTFFPYEMGFGAAADLPARAATTTAQNLQEAEEPF